MIREDEGQHGFGDRNEARQDARIVAPHRRDRRRRTTRRHGALLSRQAARRFDGRAQEDGHARGDASEHAAVMVRLGRYRGAGDERIIVLAAAHRGSLEAGAVLDANHRGAAEARRADARLP